ncbi:hypothetical protein CGCA056_v006374 [Colletotrichum aenigma]|uniref:uncharacterized protein n=1 Tax=Colletotrichum aenigma TaxID=1215731 RepID=UPI001872EA86|nr:uncharacterized protein CGCA056_v006374 [Colletotrichum aenigma]KAF5522505.1 hypothetical protein CGCA056_v006374 [Colletotrichum aenigma]
MSQKFRRYRAGRRLNLYSYNPVDPHGTTKYLPNNLPDDLTPGWVRGFDPTNLPPTSDLILEVFESLSCGNKKCNQITACRIVMSLENHHDPNVQGPREGQQWPDLVVCKAFDPSFYPILGGRGVDKAAEAALSREAGAYRYLYSNNMTGFPHPTPEFYGTYVAVFELGFEDDNLIDLGLEDKHQAYRCVPVILMEHVEGFSMENLCTRHDTTHELIPRNLLPIFHYDANGSPVTLELHKQNRKEIMRQVLDGLVKMLHVGLEFGAIEARQIMITIKCGQHDLEVPRAVVSDYTMSDVWCMTRVGKTVHRHRLYDLQKLPKPVHPMQIFDFEELHSTIGFWPSSYCYETKNDDEAREAEWARDSEGIRIRDDNGRLRHKCEVEYSVYKTWYLIQEAEERAREAAAKEAFTVEKALRDWLRDPAKEAEEAAKWAAVKETSMELAMDAVVTASKRAFKYAHAAWYEEKERQEQKGGQIEDVAIDVTDDATADDNNNDDDDAGDDDDDDYDEDDNDNEDEIDYFPQFFGAHEDREVREAVAFQKAQELRDVKDALRNLRAEEAGSSHDVPDVEQVRDTLEV